MQRLLQIRVLALNLMLAVVIAACQSPTNSPKAPSETSSTSNDSCQTIAHASGEAEICGQPRRIVALGPYVLEPLVALAIQPIGFADHTAFGQDIYDNPSQQIPYIGDRITNQLENVGTAFTPSIEAIAKAQPDLIVVTEYNAQQYEALSQIAPTILLAYSNAEESLELIARAVDRPKAAKQLIADTKQQVTTARETFSDFVSAYPKALLLFSRSQELSLSQNSQELCNAVVRELGFQLVSFPESDNTDSKDTVVPISSEQLSNLNDADLLLRQSNRGDIIGV